MQILFHSAIIRNFTIGKNVKEIHICKSHHIIYLFKYYLQIIADGKCFHQY